MSLFDQYMSGLSRATADVFGEKVTFTSLNGPSRQVVAVQGSTSFESQSQDFTTVTFRTTDWLIDVCDLSIDGTPITPKEGDTIALDKGPTRRVYSVGFETGGNVWTYSDRGGTRYRIHTQLQTEGAR